MTEPSIVWRRPGVPEGDDRPAIETAALPDGTVTTVRPRHAEHVELGARLNYLGTTLWRHLEAAAPQLAVIEPHPVEGRPRPRP